jgi:hypothetical protein
MSALPLYTSPQPINIAHPHPQDCGTPHVVVAARVKGLDTWLQADAKPVPAQRYLDNLVAYEPGVEVVARPRLTTTADAYVL